MKVLEARIDFVRHTARKCHEVNKAYCEALGDHSQLPWAETDPEIRKSAIMGVTFFLNNTDATPKDMHNSWLVTKGEQGWRYGSVKDVERKLHPCFCEYEHLPLEQRIKDSLFIAVVRQELHDVNIGRFQRDSEDETQVCGEV